MLLPPLFAASVAIFSKLPSVIAGTLFLLLFLTQSLTLAWVILLKNNLEICQKYLKQFAPPGFDPDNQEEYSEIRTEVLKEDEFKNWK